MMPEYFNQTSSISILLYEGIHVNSGKPLHAVTRGDANGISPYPALLRFHRKPCTLLLLEFRSHIFLKIFQKI